MTDGQTPLGSTGTPVFEVAVTTSGLDLEVRANDVPVMRVSGGHVETSFDVNPHVVTGHNHLGAVVRPSAKTGEHHPAGEATIVLRVRDAPGGSVVQERGRLVFATSELAADTAFSRSVTPERAEPVVQVGAGDVVRARIPVVLATPFAPWSWLGADTLTHEPATFDDVLAQTRALWSAIQAKDVPGLQAAATPQARDWQRAYFLPDEATAHRMLGVAQTLGDPDVEAMPFPDPGELSLELLGFGKLAHLVDAHGKGPIALGVKGNPRMTGRFTAIFCRHGQTWTMIR
ncbi:hypothetical protein [Paraliomyxa miuraensis]|uniref:hypothetical protein n=1 Tax=Paraliomyxa miuraensis TaxID=376150 RepID=UPI00224F6A23|nr:hypothetical protein [Paraliomyxa miuraensis]MCX4241531.1 hypothetical protein [Paraliomyxa miuraensis]